MLDGAQCPVGHTSLETVQKEAFLCAKNLQQVEGREQWMCVCPREAVGAFPARPLHARVLLSLLRTLLTSRPWRDGLCVPPAVLPHREAGLCLLHTGPPGRNLGRAQETVEQATFP